MRMWSRRIWRKVRPGGGEALKIEHHRTRKMGHWIEKRGLRIENWGGREALGQVEKRRELTRIPLPGM